MTRPIFEPASQRDIARSGFGKRQLFRRPAAAAPAEPVFDAYSQIEVDSNGTQAANADQWITRLQTDSIDTSVGVIQVSQRASDSRWGIRILEPGIYLLESYMRYVDDVVNPIAMWFEALDDAGSPGTLNPYIGVDWGTPVGSLANFDGEMTLSWMTMVIDDADAGSPWEDMTGGHGVPLRVGVKYRHSEAINTAMSGDLRVTQIHPL